MPVTAGCGQPGLETNLLSVGSDILYVVSYHLLGVRGRARLLLLPRPEKNTASDDVVTSTPSGCPPVISGGVPVACFTIKLMLNK